MRAAIPLWILAFFVGAAVVGAMLLVTGALYYFVVVIPLVEQHKREEMK